MYDLLKNCILCPRMCGVDRTRGEHGICGMSGEGIMVARAAPHYWEEPCISGEKGSGTVFFSGCSLGCLFCQNKEISRGKTGKEIDSSRLAGIFLELQEKGVHNINLVTPTHYTPQIIDALKKAKEQGLGIPVVFNTSGYERTETLRMYEGLIDIWLPDFKYLNAGTAGRYSRCGNYAEYALPAIREMLRQSGAPVFDEDGMMLKGVIVRHLCLPGCSDDSKAVLKVLHDSFGNDIYISIMGQYTPFGENLPDELQRRLTQEEYDDIVDFAVDIGIENGFTQDLETADESFIPDFDCRGV